MVEIELALLNLIALLILAKLCWRRKPSAHIQRPSAAAETPEPVPEGNAVAALPVKPPPWPQPVPVSYQRQAPSDGTTELLVRGDGSQWRHHSFRPDGHRDIDEALATPGMAICRIKGGVAESVEEGTQ